MTGKKDQIGLVLILAWVLIVISAYYIFHKPISSAQIEIWVRAGGQVISGAAVLVLAGGIGKRLFSGKGIPTQEALIIQGSLGLGLVGTGLLGWGILIGYQRWVLIPLTLILLIAFFKSSLGWAAGLGKLTEQFRKTRGINLVLALIVLVVLAAGLLRALAPPLKYDALVYHLSLPSRYLSEGQFHYIQDNVYWGMPQLQEMLFVLSMAFAGAEAAPVLGWWIAAFSLLSVFLLVRRSFGETPAWIAVLALVSGRTTAQSLSWGYSIWLNILWGTAFLMAFCRRKQLIGERRSDGERADRKELSLLIAAGLFAGFASGTKYTSGLLVPVGLVLILGEGFRATGRQLWKRLGLFLLPAGLAFSPWAFKNWAGTGNPLYPFFFPGGAMDSWRQAVLSYPEGAASVWEVLGLPAAFTILGVEGGPGYAASIGPLLLALGAVGLLGRGNQARSSRHALRIAKICFLTGLFIWGLAGLWSAHLTQTRLYAVIFPAGAVLVGAGFDALRAFRNRFFRLQNLILGLVLLVGMLNVIQVVSEDLRAGTARHLLGVIDDREYLANNLGWYAAAADDPEGNSGDLKMVLLWEPRGYYCLPDCDSDEIIDRWHSELRLYGSGPAVIRSWKDQGFTHLLYHRAGAEFVRKTDMRFSSDSWKALDKTLDSLDLVQEYGSVYQLYRLGTP